MKQICHFSKENGSRTSLLLHQADSVQKAAHRYSLNFSIPGSHYTWLCRGRSLSLKNIPCHGVCYVLVITSSTDAFCKVLDITLQENNYRILFVLNLIHKRDWWCWMCTSGQNFLTLFSCSSSLESTVLKVTFQFYCSLIVYPQCIYKGMGKHWNI